MPRPEYIARLHAVLYDLRTCDPAQRPEMRRRYLEALRLACERAGISESALKGAVRLDYPNWVREKGLPRIDRKRS